MSENNSLKDIVKYRMEKIKSLRKHGVDLYPHKYEYTHKSSEIYDGKIN